ncbi:MAG: hypothetical protein NE334_04250 [Lentisphaeraceae bacterium]|nr:hypothetical protein [Lentisphaeraceae bacterium]
MKKLAIFVEGQTEQIFVEKLIFYIADSYDICVEKRRGFGGRDHGRKFITLSSPEIEAPYYILLVDSSNDGRVLTDIREEYDGLIAQGYDKIIGLRDIYPHEYKDFRKLKKLSKHLVPKGKVQPVICFAVLEVETWFVAEYKHFKKIHQRLTPQFIKKRTGIDVTSGNLENELYPFKDELRNSPAADLNRIYNLVKRSYSKKKQQVMSIMKVLNMKEIVNEVPKRIPSLGFFLRQLDDFFSSVQEEHEKSN